MAYQLLSMRPHCHTPWIKCMLWNLKAFLPTNTHTYHPTTFLAASCANLYLWQTITVCEGDFQGSTPEASIMVRCRHSTFFFFGTWGYSLKKKKDCVMCLGGSSCNYRYVLVSGETIRSCCHFKTRKQPQIQHGYILFCCNKD